MRLADIFATLGLISAVVTTVYAHPTGRRLSDAQLVACNDDMRTLRWTRIPAVKARQWDAYSTEEIKSPWLKRRVRLSAVDLSIEGTVEGITLGREIELPDMARSRTIDSLVLRTVDGALLPIEMNRVNSIEILGRKVARETFEAYALKRGGKLRPFTVLKNPGGKHYSVLLYRQPFGDQVMVDGRIQTEVLNSAQGKILSVAILLNDGAWILPSPLEIRALYELPAPNSIGEK